MTIASPNFAAQSGADDLIQTYLPEAIALRHALHAAPELGFQERRSTARIAELLQSWGYQVDRITPTGLIASLSAGAGPSLGLRADIDASPIEEATGLPFASRVAGVMHSAGHDGHSAILLLAARVLAKRKHFNGTLRLIFQPAQEQGRGAKALIDFGLFRLFDLDAIYGLQNSPGLALGKFGFVEGPVLPANDQLELRILGATGPANQPHQGFDPIVSAAHLVTALQSLGSRNIDLDERTEVKVNALLASSLTPHYADLKLRLRSYRPEVRQALQSRVVALIEGLSESFGAKAQITLSEDVPAVINHRRETRLIREIAAKTLGAQAVEPDFVPRHGSNDFAYYLAERSGSLIFSGNGSSAPLQSPEYRFNDESIAPAAHLWVALAEHFLKESKHV